MEAKEQLRECPFCGNQAEITEVTVDIDYSVMCDTNYIITCKGSDCFLNSGVVYTEKEEAVRQWNNRLLSSQCIPSEKVPEEDDIDILIFYDDTFDRGFYDEEDNKYYIFIGDEILAVNATHYQIITEPK